MVNLFFFASYPLYSTPWLRVVYYDVPAQMPPCPPDGCHCAVSCIHHRYVVLNIYLSLVGLGMHCPH